MPHNYENNPPLGIDLGTSNSAISYYVNSKHIQGSQVYYHNTYGSMSDLYLLPSSLYLEEDNEGEDLFLIGKAAENKWENDPTKYASGIKRKIGEKDKVFRLGEKNFSPIDLSSEIIKALFKDPIKQNKNLFPSGIVISVPYYFKQPQNDNTLLALNIALKDVFLKKGENKIPKVLGLVPEPIAASLYYATSLKMMSTINQRKIMIFDLGGGTLDITIFSVTTGGGKFHFEILSSEGSASFGGEDFDEMLMAYIIEEEEIHFKGLSEKLCRRNKKIIKDAVREAKERLSFSKEVDLFVGNLSGERQVIDAKIRRTTFEQILSGKNILQRNFGKELLEAVTDSLIKSNLKKDDIDLVLLIGSSSQIPYFQNLLKKNLKNAQFEERQDFLKYAVAKGAALYAAYLLDKDYGHSHQAFGKSISYEKSEFIFRTPHSYSIEKQRGQLSIIIPANTVVPIKKTKIVVPTAYKDDSKQMVKLDAINIYEGDLKDKDGISVLGFVKEIPAIYVHGRNLSDIKIKIDFEATETTLSAHILIPKSNKHGKDILLHTNISTINH